MTVVERVRVQAQAIEQRAGEAVVGRGAQVLRVGRLEFGAGLAQARGERAQRRVAPARAATRPCARRRRGRRRPARRGWRRCPFRSCADCPPARQVLHGRREISRLDECGIAATAAIGAPAAASLRFAGPRRKASRRPGGDGAGRTRRRLPSNIHRDPMKQIIALAALAVSALAPTLAHAGLDSDNPIHPLVGMAHDRRRRQAGLGRIRRTAARATSPPAASCSSMAASSTTRRARRSASRPPSATTSTTPAPTTATQRFQRWPIEVIGAVQRDAEVPPGRRRALRRGAPSSPATVPAYIGNADFKSQLGGLVMAEWLITPSMGVQLRYVNEKYKVDDTDTTGTARHDRRQPRRPGLQLLLLTPCVGRRRASSRSPGKIAAAAGPTPRHAARARPPSARRTRRGRRQPTLRRDLSGSSAPCAPGERARAHRPAPGIVPMTRQPRSPPAVPPRFRAGPRAGGRRPGLRRGLARRRW